MIDDAKLQGMKTGEFISEDKVHVLKVPGGWVFTLTYYMSSVFVPYPGSEINNITINTGDHGENN